MFFHILALPTLAHLYFDWKAIPIARWRHSCRDIRICAPDLMARHRMQLWCRSHMYITYHVSCHEKMKGIKGRHSKHGAKNHQDGPLCGVTFMRVLCAHLWRCFFCFFFLEYVLLLSCHRGVKEVPWTQRGSQKDEGICKNLSPGMFNDDWHQDELDAAKPLRLCFAHFCVFVCL